MKSKHVIGRVSLVIDTSDDYTPALVVMNKHPRASSTYDVATATGEIGDGELYLEQGELATLELHRDEVDKAWAIARPHGWVG